MLNLGYVPEEMHSLLAMQRFPVIARGQCDIWHYDTFGRIWAEFMESSYKILVYLFLGEIVAILVSPALIFT